MEALFGKTPETSIYYRLYIFQFSSILSSGYSLALKFYIFKVKYGVSHNMIYTVCPRSHEHFYKATLFMEMDKTSWKCSTYIFCMTSWLISSREVK